MKTTIKYDLIIFLRTIVTRILQHFHLDIYKEKSISYYSYYIIVESTLY